jgi:V/A-type H+-transporting ATPase subunit B
MLNLPGPAKWTPARFIKHFAKDYSNQLLAIDVNLDTTEMLDVAWGLFGRYFRPEEVNIKKELVDQYWPKGE